MADEDKEPTVQSRRGTQQRSALSAQLLRALVLAGASLAALAAPASASAAGTSAYFTSTAKPVKERVESVAAPLPDGDVLIAGGLGTEAEKSAEVFDPATGTFTLTGALQVARVGAVAAPLPDGDVLIAGGSVTGTGKTVELFNPATGTFAAASPELLADRTAAVAAPLPGGDVLIAGGSVSGAEKSAEVLEPEKGVTAVGPMAIERVKAVAAPLPGGDVLVAGGKGASAEKSAVLFDPTTKAFTAVVGAEHVAREAAVAGSLADGEVLIAGGSGSETSAELFSPTTETFEAPPSSPPNTELREDRVAASAAPLANGQLLIVGGTAALAEKSAELFFSAPQAAFAGGAFGDETVAQPSAASVLLVTNVGAQALSIATPSLTSAEFAITSETCAGRTLAFGQSCTISVRFTPSATGAKEATIALPDNEPAGSSTIKLTGTGVAASTGPKGETGQKGEAGQKGETGPTGATGATGATGSAGARGPAGTPGQVILVTCTTSTKTVDHKPKKATKCTSRPVPSPTTFTSDSLARATLGRHGFVYATGTAEKGRVVLHATRALSAGRYTLTLVSGHGRRALVRRMAVELP
jgi:hypothetical protein